MLWTELHMSLSAMFRWVFPFHYFFESRVVTLSSRISWGFIYPVPVLVLSCLPFDHTLYLKLTVAGLSIIAIYSVYEFGYLVNDAITVNQERNPTLRLAPDDRASVASHWQIILLIRVSSACAALLGIAFVCRSFGASVTKPVMAGVVVVASILLIYFWYNRNRGRVTVPLFLLLVALRFGGPIMVAVSILKWPTWHLAMAILLIYPLPCTIEKAGKARFGLPWLGIVASNVDAWRIVYYFVLALWVFATPKVGGDSGLFFQTGSLYFLGYRVLTFLVGRKPESRQVV